jgi:hypothetical protein
MLREYSKVEQRYDAVLAIIRDGMRVSEVADTFGVHRRGRRSRTLAERLTDPAIWGTRAAPNVIADGSFESGRPVQPAHHELGPY